MDPQWKMVKEDGSAFPHAENPAVLAVNKKKPVRAVMGIECGVHPIRWIRINAVPCQIQGKTHAIVSFADISDERLEQVQNQLVLETSGVGIWRLNVQTRELQWDSSMYQLYEVKQEDFTGDYDAWKRSIHPLDVERIELELQKTIAGGSLLDSSFRIIANDRVKFIRARASLLKDAKNQAHVIIGTNWDITDIKEREEALKSLSEVKDKFIATMSHEVRTPLNGIIGMSEIIANQVEDAEVQQHMRSIIQSANHFE